MVAEVLNIHRNLQVAVNGERNQIKQSIYVNMDFYFAVSAKSQRRKYDGFYMILSLIAA